MKKGAGKALPTSQNRARGETGGSSAFAPFGTTRVAARGEGPARCVREPLCAAPHGSRDGNARRVARAERVPAPRPLTRVYPGW